MCFSATASFLSSGVLGGIGVLALRKTNHHSEKILASVPLFFASQQLIEGFIWENLTLTKTNFGLVSTGPTDLTIAYSVFAFLLWPVVIPLGVSLVEKDPRRKKWIQGLALMGAAVTVYMIYCLLHYPLVSWVRGHHLEYSIHIPHETPALILYGLIVVVSCFLSKHRWIVTFGGALIVSLVGSFIIYFETFFSVWCFFAAILSSLLYMHFYQQRYQVH